MWLEAALSLGVLGFNTIILFRMNRMQEEIDILRQCSDFAYERIKELELARVREATHDANSC